MKRPQLMKRPQALHLRRPSKPRQPLGSLRAAGCARETSSAPQR
jgi:hypothetical protein